VRELGVTVALLITLGISTGAAGEYRPNQDDADLRSVAQLGGAVAWAVGDRGTAFSSLDSGKSWTPVPLPVEVSGRSVCFLTNQVGWIAGDDERPGHRGGLLLATRDGGKSWTVSYPPMERICLVRFYDLEHGLLVGEGDVSQPTGVVETNDGGRTWRAVGGNRSTDWRTAAVSDNKSGVVAGGGLRMGMLSDGALLERPDQPAGRKAWRGAAISGHGTGWLVGDAASVLVKRSREATWHTPPTPLPSGLGDAMAFRAVAAIGDKAWIVGDPGNAIWHTEDGGTHWERQSTGQTLPLYAVAMQNDGVGIAVGALGLVIRTSDGGRHWDVVRGKGRRLALLAVHVTQRTLPLGVLARDSAELGYRSKSVVFTGTPRQARWADRTARALGSQGADTEWRLPWNRPELSRNSTRLDQLWQAETEGRLDNWLLGRCVDLLRTWRPSVVVVDAPAATDHAAVLVHKAMFRAVQEAADPTRWSVRSSLNGLSPWSVRRMFERHVDGDSLAVHVRPGTHLPRHGGVVSTLVEQSVSHDPGFQGRGWDGDRLKRIRGTGKAVGDSACQGLGLVPGSAARRLHPQDARHPENFDEMQKRRSRALEGWIRLAERGEHPLEMLTAELLPLLRPLGEDRGGWRLWGIAQRFKRSGHVELSDSLLKALLDRFPEHEASSNAAMSLLASTVSGEKRWQRLRRTNREYSVVSNRVDPTSGATRAAALSQKQAVRIANGPDWRAEMTRVEIDNSIRLARHLKQTSPRTYEAGSTQLTLAALFRSRGANRLADVCVGRIAGRPGDWRTVAKHELWLTNRSGNPPVDSATCSVALERPIVDGVISDRCWEMGQEMRLRSTTRSLDSAADGFVVTACDDEHFYVAARLEKPGPSRCPPSLQRWHDADHTGFDRVTIFLDVDRDYQTGYELTVDERGEVSEACGGDPSWNPRCVVAVDSDENVWRLELAIPWSELAPRRPSAGSCWGLRLVRTMPAVGWQGWGGRDDQQGKPTIGAGFLSFGGRGARRRRK
tara:strand:+ start:351 stop:3383 length:3033 start_codon:yes stop_codon:yes gene_type:complete